jgi:hypothetical protein
MTTRLDALKQVNMFVFKIAKAESARMDGQIRERTSNKAFIVCDNRREKQSDGVTRDSTARGKSHS